MYLEMMRRGIEFDAEHAFKNMPEVRAYQDTWDVVEETFDFHLEKFFHMTKDVDTLEAIEQRNTLLTNLGDIAIRCIDSQLSLRKDVRDLVERRRAIYPDELNGTGPYKPEGR